MMSGIVDVSTHTSSSPRYATVSSSPMRRSARIVRTYRPGDVMCASRPLEHTDEDARRLLLPEAPRLRAHVRDRERPARSPGRVEPGAVPEVVVDEERLPGAGGQGHRAGLRGVRVEN